MEIREDRGKTDRFPSQRNAGSKDSTAATVRAVTAITSPSHFVFTKHTVTSRRTPSPMKPTSFASLLQRMKVHDDKRNRSLEQARQAAEAQLHTPRASLINKASKAMVSSMVPIHERFQKVIDERQKHIESLREAQLQAATARESSELSFRPKICPSPRRRMTPEKFYQYSEEWAESAKKKKESFRETVKSKEMEGVTFKPKINKSHWGGGKKESPGGRGEGLGKDRGNNIKEMEKKLKVNFSPKQKETELERHFEIHVENEPSEPISPPPQSSLDTLFRLLGSNLPLDDS